MSDRSCPQQAEFGQERSVSVAAQVARKRSLALILLCWEVRRAIKSGTLLQCQCALDSVIARQGPPDRKRAVEICVRMFCAHARMPALVLRVLGWKNGDIPSLAQRRRAAKQLRGDRRVGIHPCNRLEQPRQRGVAI